MQGLCFEKTGLGPLIITELDGARLALVVWWSGGLASPVGSFYIVIIPRSSSSDSVHVTN